VLNGAFWVSFQFAEFPCFSFLCLYLRVGLMYHMLLSLLSLLYKSLCNVSQNVTTSQITEIRFLLKYIVSS
jgi:hypothetical protein